MKVTLIDFTFKNDCTIEELKTFRHFTGPAWTFQNGVRRPVCYAARADKLITATATVSGQPPKPVQLLLRAESQNPPLRFEGAVMVQDPGAHTVTLALREGTLGEGAREIPLTLSWSFSTGAGSVSLETVGPITLYQVLTCPAPAYDVALEHACRYAAGGPDPAAAICRGIAGEIFYAPGSQNLAHTLKLYQRGAGDCNAHAGLMKLLCRTIGLDAELLFVWAGDQTRRITFRYRPAGSVQRPTIMMRADQADGAERNPHFRLHVQVRVNSGRVFDPSYGTEGLARVCETAPGAQVIVAGATVFREDHSESTCPHGEGPESVDDHRGDLAPETAPMPPGELIAGVDVPAMIRAVLPGGEAPTREPQRYGMLYTFAAALDDPAHEVALGILPTIADASQAFEEVKRQSEAPPERVLTPIGDQHAVWLPVPGTDWAGGALLFQRGNVVVYLTGRFSPARRELLARQIDQQLTLSPPPTWVIHGVPHAPGVSVPAPALNRLSRTVLQLPIVVDYPPGEELFLFTPDVDIARIYDRVLHVYPPHPGAYEPTIVAVTSWNVVARTTVQLDFPDVSE